MNRKAIVFCAGGTAGHTFPAAALALDIKKRHCNTILITDLRGVKYVKDEFTKVIALPISRLGLEYFIKAPYLFIRSFIEIMKANKVVCFGGYISLFPFLAAVLLRKERVIYQLDSHITRLNRLLIPFAHTVLYGFAHTNLKKHQRNKAYCFGIPVRNGFEFSFIKKADKLTIAVIGGSLGSAYWKKLISDTLSLLPASVRKTISLKIQTSESLDFLKKFDLADLESKPFYDTANLFNKSHLIIARAGATSIAEISSVARAAYLVPWENAVENHQYKNARNYACFQGAEFGNDPKQLADYISKIAKSDQFFYQVCENASRAFPQYAKNKAGAFLANGNLKHSNDGINHESLNF